MGLFPDTDPSGYIESPTIDDHYLVCPACINDEQHLAYIATYGQLEPLAKGTTGTPRPITIERKHGRTDIEMLTRQVYLLAQCHIGVANTTTRLPITTAYADRAAAKGHLPMTADLETGIGFL